MTKEINRDQINIILTMAEIVESNWIEFLELCKEYELGFTEDQLDELFNQIQNL